MSEEPIEAELSDQQRVFMYEYLQCWNGAEAARRAGYSEETARQQASRLLTNVNIREAIEREIEKRAMGAGEVLGRLAEQARGSMAPFLVENIDGMAYIDLTTVDAKKNWHLLKKVKCKRRLIPSRDEDEPNEIELETEVEIHDPQAALVHLGRHHKLFTDKQQLSGEDGAPVLAVYINGNPSAPKTGDSVPDSGN